MYWCGISLHVRIIQILYYNVRTFMFHNGPTFGLFSYFLRISSSAMNTPLFRVFFSNYQDRHDPSVEHIIYSEAIVKDRSCSELTTIHHVPRIGGHQIDIQVLLKLIMLLSWSASPPHHICWPYMNGCQRSPWLCVGRHHAINCVMWYRRVLELQLSSCSQYADIHSMLLCLLPSYWCKCTSRFASLS